MIIGLSDTIPMFKLASATFHTCSRGDLSKSARFFFEQVMCTLFAGFLKMTFLFSMKF